MTPARPTYTDRPPRVPGLYWYRVGHSQVDRYCRVWKVGGKLVAAADGAPKEVRSFQRRWAGPLPEPAP